MTPKQRVDEDKELQFWRWKAHTVMDASWKSGLIKRAEMYAMLHRELKGDIHVSTCSVEECKQIINLFNPELLTNWKKLKSL